MIRHEAKKQIKKLLALSATKIAKFCSSCRCSMKREIQQAEAYVAANVTFRVYCFR